MHLSDSEIIKYVKGYYDEGTILDENNEIKSDFKELANRINSHISECEVCKKRLNEIKEKFLNNKDFASEIVKGLEEEMVKENPKTTINNEEVQKNMFATNQYNDSVVTNNMEQSVPVSTYDSSFGLDQSTLDGYRKNPEILNPAQQIAYENQIGGRQKKLVLPDSKGFADALVLALITGFAGGLFVSVILMLCK